MEWWGMDSEFGCGARRWWIRMSMLEKDKRVLSSHFCAVDKREGKQTVLPINGSSSTRCLNGNSDMLVSK